MILGDRLVQAALTGDRTVSKVSRVLAYPIQTVSTIVTRKKSL
ncbi:hypothetical protein QUB30_22605 [Microcoleus sp. BROC3]